MAVNDVEIFFGSDKDGQDKEQPHPKDKLDVLETKLERSD